MSEQITGSNGERAAANFLFSVQLRLHLLMETKGVIPPALDPDSWGIPKLLWM